MSDTVRRIEISGDVDFFPDEDTTGFFEFYEIEDPEVQERVVQKAADAMRAYEATRTRQRQIEERVAKHAIAAARAS